MEDLYKVLGVEKTVDVDTLKKTYHDLARKFHPDKNPGSKEAEEKFKAISNAYDILADPQKKAAYDQGDFTGGPTQAHYGNSPFTGFTYSGSTHGDINDIFSKIFTQNGSTRQQVYQNQHINLNYQITLEEAFNGKEAELSFSFKLKQHQKLKLTIPAGINNGMRIRFAGKGDDSLKGVPVGDLFVTIGVIQHARFRRIDHLTLLTLESITYLDAMLGCIKEIVTIDGSTIQIEIPANIIPGTMLKVSGKGMKDSNTPRGDLLVEVKLVPPVLNQNQKSILTSLQNELKMNA